MSIRMRRVTNAIVTAEKPAKNAKIPRVGSPHRIIPEVENIRSRTEMRR
jgi:hypothetical protein